MNSSLEKIGLARPHKIVFRSTVACNTVLERGEGPILKRRVVQNKGGSMAAYLEARSTVNEEKMGGLGASSQWTARKGVEEHKAPSRLRSLCLSWWCRKASNTALAI